MRQLRGFGAQPSTGMSLHRITIPPATCEAYAHRALSSAEWAKILSWAVALEGMLRRKRLLEMCDAVPSSTEPKGDEAGEGEDVGSSSGGEDADSTGSAECRHDHLSGCFVQQRCFYINTWCTCMQGGCLFHHCSCTSRVCVNSNRDECV